MDNQNVNYLTMSLLISDQCTIILSAVSQRLWNIKSNWSWTGYRVQPTLLAYERVGQSLTRIHIQQLVSDWRIFLVDVTGKSSSRYFSGIFSYSTLYEILGGIKILGIYYRRYYFPREYFLLPWRCYYPRSFEPPVYNFGGRDKYSRKFVPGVLQFYKKLTLGIMSICKYSCSTGHTGTYSLRADVLETYLLVCQFPSFVYCQFNRRNKSVEKSWLLMFNANLNIIIVQRT